MRKRDEFNSVVSSCDADLIFLTETWLSAKVRSNDIFQGNQEYEVYRCDREGRTGGGTLIAVSKSIPSTHINVASNLESVWVCAKFQGKKIILGACYRPPDAPSTFVDDLHDLINSIVCRYGSLPIVLLGDFNFPNICWSGLYPVLDPFSSAGQNFLNLCTCFNFTQIVKQPTRCTGTCSNTLDLILSTHPELVTSISYLPGLSDHNMLHFFLTSPSRAVLMTLKKSAITVRQISRK